MVSSADRRAGAGSAGRAGLAAAIVGFIGVVLALGPTYGATTTTAGAVGAVVGGLALVGLAVLLVLTRVAGSNARARTRQVWGPGGPAIEVALRRQLPWVRLLVGAVGAVLCAVWAVAIGGGGYVLLVPAVLLALLVPDALIAAGRRPVLRFDADGIAYDGWTARASVRWEDVEQVEIEPRGVSQRRLMVLVRPEASSFQARWRRIVLPVDRRPKRPGFGVPTVALDRPAAVKVELTDLLAMPAQLRAGALERPQTLDHLTGAGRGH